MRKGVRGRRTATVVLAMVAVILGACGRSPEEDARRYQAAHDPFVTSVKTESARLMEPLATAYLNRLAAGEATPADDVVRQFEPQVEEFNRIYCRELEDIEKAATDGDAELVAGRIDSARVLAEDLVFDAMASALLQGALAAPPGLRDQLLDGLSIRAKTDDAAMLSGVAALRDAGLVDTDGHLTFPETNRLGGDYNTYKKWVSREAKEFASRIDTLVEPTRKKLDECLPRP